MARELSVYEVLRNEVVRRYSSVAPEDRETYVFSDFFVEATAVLAAYGDSNQDINTTLCARALLSWDAAKRKLFLKTIEVPGRVHMEMIDPAEWPEFPSTTPGDVPAAPIAPAPTE